MIEKFTKAELEHAIGSITNDEFIFAGRCFVDEYENKYQPYKLKPDKKRILEIMVASIEFHRKRMGDFIDF